MLRQSPVVLLNPIVQNTNTTLMKFLNKRLKSMSIIKKLKHLLMYRSTSRFVVYISGMFFASFMILFSLSMTGLMDRMIYEGYEQTSYESIGYCDPSISCPVNQGDERVIELPGVMIDTADVTLVGLESDTSLYPLYNEKGQEITSQIENGLVITKSMHLIDGFDIGDSVDITILNNTTRYQIVAITNEYGGSKAYLERSSLSETLIDTDDYYNAVYSSNDLAPNNFLHVIKTNDILKQAGEMQQFMQMFVIAMIGISIVIGTIIIYILTVLTIEDNFYNISLFKVMGYNDTEINKIVLGGYQFYGLVTFIITIPFAIIGFYFLEVMIAEFYGVLFPVHFAWWHPLIAILMFIIVFSLGAYVAKNQLKKIALQEAMKMYQI
jgi:putative ABC transport system permease protein